jgi:hypothetical protein
LFNIRVRFIVTRVQDVEIEDKQLRQAKAYGINFT